MNAVWSAETDTARSALKTRHQSVSRLLLAATMAAAVAFPPSAHAESWIFQSPTGNIACHISETGAACDIGEYHYVAPPRPQNCQQAWGNRIAFDHGGGPAFFGCHFASFLGQLPTQKYDTPLSAGAITCEINEDTGVTCRDTSTGHFFQMSQQSYQLG